MSEVLLLIPLLPLAASALIALLGYPLLKQYSHWPCIIASALSCGLSVVILLSPSGAAVYYPWFAIGDANVSFAFQADGLTKVMLVTVTFVGSFIVGHDARLEASAFEGDGHVNDLFRLWFEGNLESHLMLR